MKNINGLTELILNDYGEKRAIDQMDVFSLPSKRKTERIVDELFEVIYPGYYHNSSLKMYNPRHTLAALVEDIAYNLEPLYSIAIAAILFGELQEVGFSFWAGIFLIVVSVFLQTYSVLVKGKN